MYPPRVVTAPADCACIRLLCVRRRSAATDRSSQCARMLRGVRHPRAGTSAPGRSACGAARVPCAETRQPPKAKLLRTRRGGARVRCLAVATPVHP
jgi:hypothetical protein